MSLYQREKIMRAKCFQYRQRQFHPGNARRSRQHRFHPQKQNASHNRQPEMRPRTAITEI